MYLLGLPHFKVYGGIMSGVWSAIEEICIVVLSTPSGDAQVDHNILLQFREIFDNIITQSALNSLGDAVL